MDERDKYHFKIEAYTPETIPMVRLAEYMRELAGLLGNSERVHFDTLIAGSTTLACSVEYEAAPKVAYRLDDIRRGEPPDDASHYQKRINDMLRDDNATGELDKCGWGADLGKQMLRFPGREIPRPKVYGPFSQLTSIDGELVRIGGRDKTAHIQIQDAEGRTWVGELSRELARELKKFLWEGPILRVEGNARWVRTEDGKWDLKSFRVADYTILSGGNLVDTVERLRAIEGNEWSRLDDPMKVIGEYRDDNEGI